MFKHAIQLKSIPKEPETSEVLQFQSGDVVMVECAGNEPYDIFDDKAITRQNSGLQTLSGKSKQEKKKLSSFLQLNSLHLINLMHKEERKLLLLNSRPIKCFTNERMESKCQVIRNLGISLLQVKIILKLFNQS